MCTVSIIVRTKDRNLLLQRAIESVMEQTFSDWELIIVNNGGDQNDLEEVIRNHVNSIYRKIKIVHLDKSNNMEVATNAGIQNSTGVYITLLDDDDTWENSYLQKCISILNTPRIYAIAAQSTLIYESIENDRIQHIDIKRFNPSFKSVKLLKLARRNLFTTNAFMYKRELLDEIGLYREDLPVLGDWEFNLRFALRFKIHVIPESLAYYHKRIQTDNKAIFSNTQFEDHLYYDRKLRKEYLMKGFRGEIPFYFGALIYSYLHINRLLRMIKKILKVR